MSSRSKDALFEAIALMGKAFASPRRLELLDLLAQAPRSVEDIARESGQSTANASQHLQALHAAGMVTRTREGARVVYALAGEAALRLWPARRPSAPTRTRRSAGSTTPAARPAVWGTAGPNGGWRTPARNTPDRKRTQRRMRWQINPARS